MKYEELNFKALSFMIFFVVDDIKIVSLYYYEFPSNKKKKIHYCLCLIYLGFNFSRFLYLSLLGLNQLILIGLEKAANVVGKEEREKRKTCPECNVEQQS